MTVRGLNAVGFIAVLFSTLLAASGGQHATALAASASALALVTAALIRRTRLVPLAESAEVAHAAAAARSSILDVAFLPQRDPAAAGKPRPRAPGANPATV
jgi:hypothetical protein